MESVDELENRVADALSVPVHIARLCLCDPLILSDTLEMTKYTMRARSNSAEPWRVNPSKGRPRTAALTPFERVTYQALGMMIVPPRAGGRLEIVGPDRNGRWGVYRWVPPGTEYGDDDNTIAYLTKDGWFLGHPWEIEDPSEVVHGDYVAYNPLYAILEVWQIEERWRRQTRYKAEAKAKAAEVGQDEAAATAVVSDDDYVIEE